MIRQGTGDVSGDLELERMDTKQDLTLSDRQMLIVKAAIKKLESEWTDGLPFVGKGLIWDMRHSEVQQVLNLVSDCTQIHLTRKI